MQDLRATHRAVETDPYLHSLSSAHSEGPQVAHQQQPDSAPRVQRSAELWKGEAMIDCSVCGWRHTVPCGRDDCPHDPVTQPVYPTAIHADRPEDDTFNAKEWMRRALKAEEDRDRLTQEVAAGNGEIVRLTARLSESEETRHELYKKLESCRDAGESYREEIAGLTAERALIVTALKSSTASLEDANRLLSDLIEAVKANPAALAEQEPQP